MDPEAAPPPTDDAPPPAPDGAAVAVAVPPPAPRPPVDKSKARQDLITTGILLGAAIVVIGVIFSFVKLWARRQSEDCESPTMSLSSFREMYENGELSQEEYEQIRAKMAAKMKGSLGIKPLPEPDPPESPPVGRNGVPPSAE